MNIKQNLSISFFVAFSVIIFNSCYASKIYDGKATSILTTTINAGTDFNFYGDIEYVARKGQIITPEITDSEGNIIKKGTLLLKLSTIYWTGLVDMARDNLNASEEILKTAKENFIRYKTLSKTEAVSIKMYERYRAEYYTALNKYSYDKCVLGGQEQVLRCCTHIAPFEGIVDEVKYVQGRASGNPQTIKISQLNPIGIKVKMSREDANRIKSGTPILVSIPNRNISQGVFYGYSILDDDGIIFITENALVLNNIDSNGKIIPIIRLLYPVLNFFSDGSTNTLAVPLSALFSDDKGKYVWKAKNETTMQKGKGINSMFSVEKVYVVSGDKFKNQHRFIKAISLKDPGTLVKYDSIIADPPIGLKNGDFVNFPQERFVFMPGDSVQVTIGK
jgi:multidrug efflux pump subunit AcrA (membrane-fusion protein)